ncbi:LysR family transcriptional regulator [Photobacterium sp. ZSDE20]|uniref:LysR family transcriptional regulator n=1 Tax=Photobacterium pectinilyticum TaxID=2906793 RepID=A0ABT1N674_9GAMM|nr:LysR family transcriptional regulator [Photobacterium sp. ZSDE20]MCQ1059607.1 LysR family transcriptional regulator [Photobacterium sp. ZSDE20]MDD1828958.1 LysR family transcriptional regulator [Photobacterium sp. ZSDE20]
MNTASFSHMLSFVYSVKYGSFSEAARQIGISASAVSKNVSRLEKSYGVGLIRRTTRTLVPTDLGIQVFERLKAILEELEEVENSIQDSVSTPCGNMSIKLPRVYGGRYIVPLLHQFAQQNPELTFDIILDDRPANLFEEKFDLAIHIGELTDSNFIARKLDEEQLTTCASPEYLDMHGIPENLEDLDNHQCLILRSQITGMPEKWQFKVGLKTQAISMKSRFIINEGMALVRGADKGMGIVQLPKNMLGRSISAGRLKVILEEYQPLATPIYLVYADNNQPTRIKMLINYLLSLRGGIS